MTASDEKPEQLGIIMKRLLQSLGLEKRIGEYDALLSWNSVVGERIAKVSRVKHVKNGILFVEVRGSAWMSEIGLMKNRILERLNEAGGKGTIRDIVLSQWRERNEER